MAKKNKFDFEKLVSKGYLETGEKLYFVSDATFFASLQKTPTGEYKLFFENNYYTPHSLAITWLGMEPNNTALNWIRTQYDRTLFELWEDYSNNVAPYRKAA